MDVMGSEVDDDGFDGPLRADPVDASSFEQPDASDEERARDGSSGGSRACLEVQFQNISDKKEDIYIYIYTHIHCNSSFRCYIPTCGKGKIGKPPTMMGSTMINPSCIQGAFVQEDIRVVLCEGGPQPQRDQHHLGIFTHGISATNMVMILVNQENELFF